MKSLKGGGVEAQSTSTDVFGDFDGENSNRRRSELKTWNYHMNKKICPTFSTCWFSTSIFVPEDWPEDEGNGSGPLVWQWKQEFMNSYTSPPFSVVLTDKWTIHIRSHPNEEPTEHPDWEWGFYFNPTYPDYEGSSLPYHPWSDGLKFMPNVEVTRSALRNINKGGWTDFIAKVTFDGRTVSEGGKGKLDLWMRANNEKWVHVIDFFPSTTYRGRYGGTSKTLGNNIQHGVLYKSGPDNAISYYGFSLDLYMSKDRVWNINAPGRTLYFDNIKVGSHKATSLHASDLMMFKQMSPDWSASDDLEK